MQVFEANKEGLANVEVETIANRFVKEHFELIVGVEDEGLETVRWSGAIRSENLPIVVARKYKGCAVVGQQWPQKGVNVASAAGNGDCGLLVDGHLYVEACVQDAHIGIATDLLWSEVFKIDINNAAGCASVLDGEVARVKIDALDHAHGKHTAQPTKVVDDRDIDARDVDPRIFGSRTSNHNIGTLGSSDTGKVLNHSKHIAKGPGDALGLLCADAHLANLASNFAGLDDDVVAIVRLLFDTIARLGVLVLGHTFFDAQRIVAFWVGENAPRSNT